MRDPNYSRGQLLQGILPTQILFVLWNRDHHQSMCRHYGTQRHQLMRTVGQTVCEIANYSRDQLLERKVQLAYYLCGETRTTTNRCADYTAHNDINLCALWDK